MALLPPPSSFPCARSARNPTARPLRIPTRRGHRPRGRDGVLVVANSRDPQKPTKLVTFLGKGGSGKTTAAVLAARVRLLFYMWMHFFVFSLLLSCLRWSVMWSMLSNWSFGLSFLSLWFLLLISRLSNVRKGSNCSRRIITCDDLLKFKCCLAFMSEMLCYMIC